MTPAQTHLHRAPAGATAAVQAAGRQATATAALALAAARVLTGAARAGGPGQGLFAHDPTSSTRILFVRTEIDASLPDIVFRLHATGIHP